LEGFLALFDALTSPLVVSDIDGNINFVNRSCSSLVGRSRAEIEGASFFTLFSQPDQRGKAIDWYLKLFNTARDTSHTIPIVLQAHSGSLHCQSTSFLFRWEKTLFLVTQIEPSKMVR
jgi:PAS domain S-box-containing protein